MKYLKNYLKTISDRGNIKLAESISKTAEDVGDQYIKTFSFSSHEIGLLFGNVQSGKTAHIAALIAMYASSKCDMIIVLSGVTKSLRLQTQNRLRHDLGIDSKGCYDLITADKKDSTGICFIGERNFRSFLQNYIPNQPGDIIDIITNNVVGKHCGVMYYTIGQRKGLNLGGLKEKYFVCKKDIENKIIYVAPNSYEQTFLQSNECVLGSFN